jgi:diguanylate cyclase (GGDEF)-like protein
VFSGNTHSQQILSDIFSGPLAECRHSCVEFIMESNYLLLSTGRAVHTRPLTGLAYPTQLTAHIREALERAAHGRARVAALFLDLDGFTTINDRLGHGVGGAPLAKVAERLEGASRRGDLLARFGGDEFVLVCESVRLTEVEAIAQRMCRSPEDPIEVGGRTVRVDVSVGVAMSNQATSSEACPGSPGV